jgi:hypothetical protein
MDQFLANLTTIKLTRKEFIFYLMSLAIGLSGISSLFKLLNQTKRAQRKATSYGSGAYGG